MTEILIDRTGQMVNLTTLAPDIVARHPGRDVARGGDAVPSGGGNAGGVGGAAEEG